VPVLVGVAAFAENPDEGGCFVQDLTERKKNNRNSSARSAGRAFAETLPKVRGDAASRFMKARATTEIPCPDDLRSIVRDSWRL